MWPGVAAFTLFVISICLVWQALLVLGIVLLAALGAYLLVTGIFLGRIGDLERKSFPTHTVAQAVGNQRIFLAMLVLGAILVLGIVLTEKAAV
jgi:hypothetical protein